MGLWTNRLFKFEFGVAPPKKVHWVLWGFLRDSMRTAFFAGVLVGATEVSKKITGIRFPEHWPFQVLGCALSLCTNDLSERWEFLWSLENRSSNRQVDGIEGKGRKLEKGSETPIIYRVLYMRGGAEFRWISNMMSMYVTFSHWISLTRWCEGEKSVASSLGTKMWVEKESRKKFVSIS